MARLLDIYKKNLVSKLQEELGLKNKHSVPRLEKIVLSFNLGASSSDSKIYDKCFQNLKMIAGQCPVATAAKKSIANFKLRQGQRLGAKVTLRRARMYEFLDRLINTALPRVRDFNGFSNDSFDGQGNFSFGLDEQTVFLEVDYTDISDVKGININIITSAGQDDHARALLKHFNFPFTIN